MSHKCKEVQKFVYIIVIILSFDYQRISKTALSQTSYH